MSKKILYLILFLFGHWVYSQQNEEFKSVKDYYEYQRGRLKEAFKIEAAKQRNTEDLEAMTKDYSEFMLKLDSIQNVAMLSALIKVKNREDLERTTIQTEENATNKNKIKAELTEIPAEYPGGINEFRKKISEIFYFDALAPDVTKITTSIAFIVEKDGSISKVNASGENPVFNRQAEIAVYSLPDKFSPATLNGQNVRYSFRVPLTMNF